MLDVYNYRYKMDIKCCFLMKMALNHVIINYTKRKGRLKWKKSTMKF